MAAGALGRGLQRRAAGGGHARLGWAGLCRGHSPGQTGGPGRAGRWGRLDDGALLPEGAAGARPGQQQRLLLRRAVQQVLPVAVVDPQESQRGGGQPGQPRGPEAKLHRAERGSVGGPAGPRALRWCPLLQGQDRTPGQESGGRVLGSTFFLSRAATAAPALAPGPGRPLSLAGQRQSSPPAGSWSPTEPPAAAGTRWPLPAGTGR